MGRRVKREDFIEMVTPIMALPRPERDAVVALLQRKAEKEDTAKLYPKAEE